MLQAHKEEYSTQMVVLTESKPVEEVNEKVSVEAIIQFRRNKI
jgi:hypothetical protein